MRKTPIADMVEEMLRHEVPAPAIVLAIRTIEATRSDHVTDHVATCSDMIPARSKNALRCAAYRAKTQKNKALAKANDVAKTDPQPPKSDHVATCSTMSRHCDSFFLSSEEGSPEMKKKKEVVPRARGTRLPPDWQPGDADRQFARDHGVDPDRQRGEFVDYWVGIPGQRGTKLDWSATWRNRVRAVASRTGHGPPGGMRPMTIRDQKQMEARNAVDTLREIAFGPQPESGGSSGTAALPFFPTTEPGG